MVGAGTQLGPYKILAPLGAGGMGDVYRAQDLRLDREVAVKVLPEQYAQDPERLARFEREAKAVAALTHPNVLVLYDFGTDQGVTYAVTELLEGQTLRHGVDQGALAWLEAVQIGRAIAEGLAAAHDKRIIHRDLKPENIFLTRDDQVKILDFGLARREAPLSGQIEGPETKSYTPGQTEPGRVMGTVGYMSPEQVRGQSADARSDIFSFGCVLYEMVTGDRAFGRDTAADTIAAILREEPPDLAEFGKSVPSDVERVIRHCLEKDPEQRFQSARDLTFALGGVEQGAFADEFSKPKTIDPESMRPSVAVLPFVNMSPDQENEYFSDGLAEDLTNALCKIDRLHVASRTSAFMFKGRSQDIREIGERLNVRTVLEGSVRKAGSRLRITAQLVNVTDGYHLWSETFDRQMQDVFAVQDEIAQNIVAALRVVLSEKEKHAIAKAPTSNVQAYEYYLRGRQCFREYRREGFETARKLFMRAYELDPGYAGAYSGVADCCSMLYRNHDASEILLKEAEEAGRKALELAPDLAEAHVARGLAVSLNNRGDEALKEYEAAIRLNPELFEAYYFYSRACIEQGQFEQAAPLMEHACRVNPEDAHAPILYARVCEALGRHDECEAANRRGVDAAERHLELFPDDGRTLLVGAIGLIRIGEPERALEWAERALRAEPDEPLVLYNVACAYALLGHAEKAIDCLEQSITLGSAHWKKKWIENDSDLDSLRNHPRFQNLLKY